MTPEEAPPHSRPSNRAMRAAEDMSASEARSFFSSRSSKKSQPKTSSDKLVWFAPVHSPLLSPAREKTHQVTRKKVRQKSIFSIQSRGKGSLESEEPNSPKVSCIGQVREHRRDKDAFADAFKKKSSHSMPGSMSPARFFASPGRFSKWGSLFGSRKDSGFATPNSSTQGAGEVSCFGWPFEPRSAFQTDKTCAFLARSLDLLEESETSGSMFNDRLAQPSAANAQGYQLKKQGSIRAAVDSDFGLCPSNEVDLHSHVSARDGHESPLMEGAAACGVSVSGNLLADGKQHGGRKLSNSHKALEHVGLEKKLHEDYQLGNPPALKQRLTYSELPSLHCGASSKQNMKISVEVVPETWLWRDGETLRPDSTSHLSCILERSVSNSREDSGKAQQCEVNVPVSPKCDDQPCKTVAEDFTDNRILHVESQGMEFGTVEQHVFSVDASSVPMDDITGSTINGNGKPQSALISESSQFCSTASPCCTSEATFKDSEEIKGPAGNLSENYEVRSGEQQLLCNKSQTDAYVEKGSNMLGSSLKSCHQSVRRVGIDVSKENYSIALPPLVQKNLSSLHPIEDGKRPWSFFKARKSEPFSMQSFSALILVGYDQSPASKNTRCKDEELLKGILEVGRLSFHGSGKYFHVLNSNAAFNRSRSATSHRTVIRLQRCNSDPCRPSC